MVPNVLDALAHAGKMQESTKSDFAPARDEFLVQRIELIRALRQASSGDHLHQPEPLHDGAFKQARRRVGVVFEQLGVAFAAIGEVEAPVERSVAPRPTLLDRVEGEGRNSEPTEQIIIRDDARDEFQAERVQLLASALRACLRFPSARRRSARIRPNRGRRPSRRNGSRFPWRAPRNRDAARKSHASLAAPAAVRGARVAEAAEGDGAMRGGRRARVAGRPRVSRRSRPEAASAVPAGAA